MDSKKTIYKNAIKIILLMSLTIITTFYFTKKTVLHDAQIKSNYKTMKLLADIVSSFSQNKQTDILYIATSIVANDISYLDKDPKSKVEKYKDICPNIDEEFKSTILNYYDEEIEKLLYTKEEKIIFLKGYDKLLKYCTK